MVGRQRLAAHREVHVAVGHRKIERDTTIEVHDERGQQIAIDGEQLELRSRAGQRKPVTADVFPAYDEDGGLLVALAPR